MSLILVFILGACSNSDSSGEQELEEIVGCFKYKKNRTQITGYLNEDSDGQLCSMDVVISEGVTTVAKNAFKDIGLTSVTFPESFVSIQAYAFSGNSFSSHIYIPNENSMIDSQAFDSDVTVAIENTESCFEITNNIISEYYCRSQNIFLPEGVTTIANGAFENKGLTSVVFPSTLTSIGDNAFSGNPDLPPVIVLPSSNPTVGTDAFPNGYAVATTSACFEFDSTDTSQINSYYDNENDSSSNPACSKDVVIPQNVTHIGLEAFVERSLTSVIISNGVISIGANAFELNSLESVTIPGSVSSIGDEAFLDNVLTSVIILNGLTSIGGGAFQYNSLTAIEIPDSVTDIKIAAFYFNSLESVIIGHGIERIEGEAFKDNSDLSSVCIGASEADVFVASNAFPAGINPTYESNGEGCTN